MTRSQPPSPPPLVSWAAVYAHARRLPLAIGLVGIGSLLAIALDEVLLPISLRSIPTGYVLAAVVAVAAAVLGRSTLVAFERLSRASTRMTLELVTLAVTGALLACARLVTGPVAGLPAVVAFAAFGLLVAEVLPALAEVVVATVATLFLFLAGGNLALAIDDLAARWDVSLALSGVFVVCRVVHLTLFGRRPPGSAATF